MRTKLALEAIGVAAARAITRSAADRLHRRAGDRPELQVIIDKNDENSGFGGERRLGETTAWAGATSSKTTPGLWTSNIWGALCRNGNMLLKTRFVEAVTVRPYRAANRL